MAKRGCVSDLTSALVPGSAGALTSPLSTFGVIWLAPKVASQLPADCAEAAEAAVIAATSASSFTALLKRLFILSPDSLCAGRHCVRFYCGRAAPFPGGGAARQDYSQPLITIFSAT